MICAFLTWTLTSFAPQGGGTQPAIPENRRPTLDYPIPAAVWRFHPFVDATGAPQKVRIATAGSADLDGDGNQDLWFLAGAGPRQGEIAVQMARTSSLGRYRPWLGWSSGVWVAAATHRARLPGTTPIETILVADPTSEWLAGLYFYYHPSQSPRQGRLYLDAKRERVGKGVYEVTAAADRDGIDDILVLADPGGGATTIQKVAMDAPYGVPMRVATRALIVPVRVEKGRLLDRDGDGVLEVAVHVPGRGVAVLRDRGQSFTVDAWVPVPGGLRDLATGDLNRDGRDELALVFDRGVVTLDGASGGFTAYVSPAGFPALAGAGFLDATSDGRTDLVGFAADGRALVVHPNEPNGNACPPQVRRPAEAAAWTGSGPLGRAVLEADVDGDGDRDVVVQMPSGDAWTALCNPSRSLAPEWVVVTTLGPIGETGYVKQRVTVKLPPEALAAGARSIEAAVFLADPFNPGKWLYWGRLQPSIDLTTHEAGFFVYHQKVAAKVPGMVLGGRPFLFQNGITTGGETVLSIHAKIGPRRFQSTFLHHDPGGDGGKSAKGVKWTVRAAPPKPSVDQDLLPWN